jgi:cellulose biosynthesis protein BcsQ
MGVHKREEVTYFQVGANGDIRLTVPEGTAGSVRREYEDRETKEVKVKYELIYTDIDGMIGDITIMSGKFGDNLIIPLKDTTTGEVLCLSLGVTSNFGEDFMKKMPNIDYTKPVKLIPYSFTTDKGKTKKGITIYQDSIKISDHFHDAQGINTNGLPVPEGDTKKYTKDDWKIYYLTARKFLINYNKEKGFIKDKAVAAAGTPLVVSDSPSVLPDYEDAIVDDIAGEEETF